MTIKVVLPSISEDLISDALRDLTQILEEHTGSNNVQGILGGRHGYGVEFKNDVFEMHPFYWGDCTCGWDDMQYEFEDNTLHEEHCFQAELVRRNPEDPWTESAKLAEEYGIPMQGCALYCDCSHKALQDEFYAKHPSHQATCKIEEPNFIHYGSNFELRWYKYIGRDMEVNKQVTITEWTNIFVDCVNSLNAEGELNV